MAFEITRRQFIVLTAEAGLITLIPWPLTSGLTERDHDALLRVARTVFPHDRADDTAYVRAVARVDARCHNDPALCRMISNGLAALDWVCADGFTTASQVGRMHALRTLRGTRFFQPLYGEILEGLYGPADSWSLFIRTPS